jgi:hypothetical protein
MLTAVFLEEVFTDFKVRHIVSIHPIKWGDKKHFVGYDDYLVYLSGFITFSILSILVRNFKDKSLTNLENKS